MTLQLCVSVEALKIEAQASSLSNSSSLRFALTLSSFATADHLQLFVRRRAIVTGRRLQCYHNPNKALPLTLALSLTPEEVAKNRGERKFYDFYNIWI